MACFLAALPTAHLRNTAGPECCHPKMVPAVRKPDVQYLVHFLLTQTGAYELQYLEILTS